MKRLKWETPDVELKIVDNFRVGINFDALRQRNNLQVIALNEWYLEITSETIEFDSLAERILGFGDVMVYLNSCPSLISLDVPFPIRRQLYEISDVIGDHIHAALNCKDKYYNLYSEKWVRLGVQTPSDKASIARALWKWYYTVFQPIANRFQTIGSEHHSNFK